MKTIYIDIMSVMPQITPLQIVLPNDMIKNAEMASCLRQAPYNRAMSFVNRYSGAFRISFIYEGDVSRLEDIINYAARYFTTNVIYCYDITTIAKPDIVIGTDRFIKGIGAVEASFSTDEMYWKEIINSFSMSVDILEYIK